MVKSKENQDRKTVRGDKDPMEHADHKEHAIGRDLMVEEQADVEVEDD